MMKDKRGVHMKVQELCDCFATADPLKEMSVLQKDEDQEEAALKWIALAVLHGINANAEKITLSRPKDGKVRVTAEYRQAELPGPGPEIGGRIMEAVRQMTDLEGEKGKSPLVVGVRDGSVEMEVKLKSKEGGESITLKFPK